MDRDVTELLTPERVGELLRDAGHDVEVATVRAEPIGTGQMAASYRIGLSVAGDAGDVPPSLVAKVPTGDAERRAMSANSYRTEVDFYRHVAPMLAARLPRCWAAWRNDTGDDFVLLLEDLAPREPGDQIAGCTVDQAVAAVENLAGIHGPVWGDPRPGAYCEPFDDDAIASATSVIGVLNQVFQDRFGDRMRDDTLRAFDRFTEIAGDLLRAQAAGASSLVHGDYRLDNLLFAPDGSDVAIVDWQTFGLGLPGRDLAFFVATSLEPDVRRGVEEGLLDAYHARLVGHGVGDHDRAACGHDYSLGMLQIPLVILFGSAIATITERGSEMFGVIADRGAAAMADRGTLDMV